MIVRFIVLDSRLTWETRNLQAVPRVGDCVQRVDTYCPAGGTPSQYPPDEVRWSGQVVEVRWIEARVVDDAAPTALPERHYRVDVILKRG